MVKRTNRVRGRPKNRPPMEVIVADADAGSDGAKLDRLIASLQNSHSLTNVLCDDVVAYNVTAAYQGNVYSFANVVATNSFTSFSAQFTTFRVKAIRFDVYDQAPSTVAPAYFATYHVDGGAVSTTQQSVIDRPDAKMVPPGTGKITFTWMPKGDLENGFQGVANYTDFGGLVTSFPAGSAVAVKFLIIVKAVVQFRGRT